MSKQKKGFGRAGLSGLATTTLVIGACAAFVAPANAAPGDPGLTGPSTLPKVTQGATNQAAGDLTYEFNSAFTRGATISFALPAADCSTTALTNKAIAYSGLPTVTITDAPGSTDAIPAFTTALSSAGTGCDAASVKNVLTVTLTNPSDTAEHLDVNVSGVKYNVGSDAALANVNVKATTTGVTTVPTPDNADNATVVNKSFTFIPVTSATPGQQGAALGTATFSESTAGAYFTPGNDTEVVLTLTPGTNFTDGVQPTISVPSGWTVYPADPTTGAKGATADPSPAADGDNTYEFYVHVPAPAAGTTAKPGTVTVSGLKADAPATAQTVDVTPSVGGTAGTAMQALNVVTQDRIGGDDRYLTAASLFLSEFKNSNGGNAVLSGGEKFPDALSANYLAQDLGTGTLLTKVNSLPDATKQAILNSGIDTVYITGGEMAVSKAVQDEIAALHVGGFALAPTIQVVRLGGANRYETNAKINRHDLTASSTAVLAGGLAPYDSLAVGPIVYHKGYPLVLTNGANLNNGEEGQLKDLGVNTVVILGGEGVVSLPVQQQLEKDGYKVIRIAGTDRYETAADISQWGTEGFDANGNGKADDGVANTAQGLTGDTTNVTNGGGTLQQPTFADALSAGPVAGAELEPILLAHDVNTVGQALVDYLGTKVVGTDPAAGPNSGNNIDTLRALGLNAVTSNAMMRDAAAAIGE